MQEIVNKIAQAEQQALSIRSGAQGDLKNAQAQATGQGKEQLDQARKKAGEDSRSKLDEANAQAKALLEAAAQSAREKAARLHRDGEENIVSAARFIMERIVDSV